MSPGPERLNRLMKPFTVTATSGGVGGAGVGVGLGVGEGAGVLVGGPDWVVGEVGVSLLSLHAARGSIDATTIPRNAFFRVEPCISDLPSSGERRANRRPNEKPIRDRRKSLRYKTIHARGINGTPEPSPSR